MFSVFEPIKLASKKNLENPRFSSPNNTRFKWVVEKAFSEENGKKLYKSYI